MSRQIAMSEELLLNRIRETPKSVRQIAAEEQRTQRSVDRRMTVLLREGRVSFVAGVNAQKRYVRLYVATEAGLRAIAERRATLEANARARQDRENAARRRKYAASKVPKPKPVPVVISAPDRAEHLRERPNGFGIGRVASVFELARLA